MSKRIAVLGLSGVGKSTLISRVRVTIPLVHLQASALIKSEQAHRALTPNDSEALRTGSVFDNQALLIAGFRRETATTKLPIVFDGHSVVDGRDGLIEIPVSVFRDLRLDAICFLSADPAVIAARRLADKLRERPVRDAQTLRNHQERAEFVARRTAKEVDCPFISLSDGQVDLLERLLA